MEIAQAVPVSPCVMGKTGWAGRSRTAPGDDGDELRADGLLKITMLAQSHLNAAPWPATYARGAVRRTLRTRSGRTDSVTLATGQSTFGLSPVPRPERQASPGLAAVRIPRLAGIVRNGRSRTEAARSDRSFAEAITRWPDRARGGSRAMRRLGVHRQSVIRWARQLEQSGRAGRKQAGRAGRKPKLSAAQLGASSGRSSVAPRRSDTAPGCGARAGCAS